MNIKSFEQRPVSLWEVNRENVARLKDALANCFTEEGSTSMSWGSSDFMLRRLKAINEIVTNALAENKEPSHI